MLENVLVENTQYSEETIERVRCLVEYEVNNPEKRKPRARYLEEIDDWKLYHSLYSEWQGKSTSEMQKDKGSGAKSFYQAFKAWTKKEATDENGIENKKKRNELTQRIFTPKQNDWSAYTTINHWIDHYERNPEWQGKSITEMNKDKESGASAFYDAFNRWVKNEAINENGTTNKKKEQELIKRIFTPKKNNWSSYTTIDHWIAHHERNPEWQGKSIYEMRKGEESRKFYVAFSKWTKKETTNGNRIEDKKKRKELTQRIFTPKRNDWSSYITIDHWIAHYEKNPEWQGKSTHEMLKDKESGAQSFYAAFKSWVNKETVNEKIRKELIEIIFPSRHNDWSAYTTIDHWIAHYEKNPEWKGKSTEEMQKDKESGAKAFYAAYRVWINNEARDQNGKVNEKKRKELTQILFPPRKAPYFYVFGDEEAHFDSYPERIVGIMLGEYGLVDSFTEGINLHVHVNCKKRNSIDFLVGEAFIEYHPCSILDKKNNLSLKQAGQRKKDSITRPEYDGFEFYHIWEVEDLFNLLQEEPIQNMLPEEHRGLTKKRFKKDLRNVRQNCITYDKERIEKVN